ncbi:ion transporter, partial [archaeon]
MLTGGVVTSYAPAPPTTCHAKCRRSVSRCCARTCCRKTPTFQQRVFDCWEFIPARDAVANWARRVQANLKARSRAAAQRTGRSYRCAQAIAEHWLFELIVTVVVLLNAISLGMVNEGMSDETRNAIQIINFVCAVIFIIELAVLLFALGTVRYFSDPLHILDFLVVLVSIVDSAASIVQRVQGRTVSSLGIITGLRVVRVLRLLKIASYIEGVRRLILQLLHAIPAAFSATLLFITIMFVFAVMGMQLFGSGYEAAIQRGIVDEVPRLNFQTLANALITVFQVTDNENWNDTLTTHMSIYGGASALFFIVVIVLGNYLFLNVFMAILLSNFSTDVKDMASVVSPSGHQSGESIKAALRAFCGCLRQRCPCLAPRHGPPHRRSRSSLGVSPVRGVPTSVRSAIEMK